MRATFGLLLALVLAAPLCAREQGDFTPRGALLHARLSNAQANLKKLGGDSYLAPFERIWATAPSRDAAEMQPLIDELRAYIPSANSLEFALGDIMVREPYTQTITVVELTEGAPEEFSEPLREWVKQEFGRKAKAEPKALDMETVRAPAAAAMPACCAAAASGRPDCPIPRDTRDNAHGLACLHA